MSFPGRRGRDGEASAEFQMSPACPLHEGMPDCMYEVVFDEEMPEAV